MYVHGRFCSEKELDFHAYRILLKIVETLFFVQCPPPENVFLHLCLCWLLHTYFVIVSFVTFQRTNLRVD